MNVNIHIERIVLDGVSVSYHQQPLLKAAVGTELSRLLSANGLNGSLMSGGAISVLPAYAIQLTDESKPTGLGQQIARSVYEGLSR